MTNTMLNLSGLFYAERLGNCVPFTLIFTFLYHCFFWVFFFFAHSPIKYEIFSSRSVWTIVMEVMAMKGYSTLCTPPELEPHHQIQFIVVPREWSYCCILTFDPAKHTIPKWCTRRKWHIPMASNRKKLRRQIWVTKWVKVKAHDTLIDWCTGREWPLNCITVISAWWRSNMPFQRLSGRLNYYITRCEQEVSELEIRQVGDKMW